MSLKKFTFYVSNIAYLAIGSSNAVTINGFSCPQFGPFEIGCDDQDITINYFYDTPNNMLLESMTLSYPGEDPFYSARTKSHQTGSGIANSATFTVPLNSYFNERGLAMSFKATNYTTSRTIYNTSVEIYPIRSEVINPLKLENKKYVAKPVKFSMSVGRINSPISNYDFTDFSEYLESNSYLYLDVSSFKFKYSGDEEFDYGTCQLKFIDSKNLFPYYSAKTDGYKHIPLKLINNDNEISMTYRRTFYYEPNSMQISDIWRNDFEKTEYFYLPLNHKEDIKDYSFIITLADIGTSKLTIEFETKYETGNNLFGSSTNSDNWIEGGIVK